jgi:NAD(P)H-dependent FMN reductase
VPQNYKILVTARCNRVQTQTSVKNERMNVRRNSTRKPIRNTMNTSINASSNADTNGDINNTQTNLSNAERERNLSTANSHHPRVLVVIGAAAEERTPAIAAHAAAEQMRSHGAWVDVVELGTTPLPLFAPDSFQNNAQYQALKRLVDATDVFVLVTPDYHGSMSGILKNFLDHFWVEFAGRLFGTICSSYEKGLTVMDQVRTAVRQCYGWSLPYGVALSTADVDVAQSAVSSDALRKRLAMLARDLVVYGSLLAAQRQSDLEGDDVASNVASNVANNVVTDVVINVVAETTLGNHRAAHAKQARHRDDTFMARYRKQRDP